MKWIMSVAAGLAIGYFVYQMIVSSKNGESRTTGRIHKSTKDKKIAGVCGGIGEYFGIDPTLIRLGFVALSLLAGGGLAVYIIAAIIMPERDACSRTADHPANM